MHQPEMDGERRVRRRLDATMESPLAAWTDQLRC